MVRWRAWISTAPITTHHLPLHPRPRRGTLLEAVARRLEVHLNSHVTCHSSRSRFVSSRCEIRLALERIYIIAKLFDHLIPPSIFRFFLSFFFFLFDLFQMCRTSLFDLSTSTDYPSFMLLSVPF